jgi:predicted CopG family antitoxin
VEEVTEAKTIKISKETYVKLSEVAGELQMKLKRPVSFDEAMQHLLSFKKRDNGVKITDLAGSWEMSDEEWSKIKASLTEAWSRWRSPEANS